MFDSASRRTGHTTASGAVPLRRPLLAGMGALLAAGVLAAPAQAAFPGSNGRVIYEQYQPVQDFQASDLFTSAADGSDATRLLGDPDGNVNYFDASVSADGKSVTYFTSGYDNQLNSWTERLWKAGLDGSGVTRLVPDEDYAVSPTWSPDGKQIAYIRLGSRNFGLERTHSVAERAWDNTLWIANADNSGSPVQVDLKGWEGGQLSEPQWSPDGKWIAFDDGRNVFVVSAQGGEPVQVDSDGGYSHTYANWSPDGKKLVFASNDDSSISTIVTRAVDDGTPTGDETTIGSGRYADTPVFSPDGKKVLWTQYETAQAARVTAQGLPSTRYIAVANADGSGAGRFLDPAPNGTTDEPDWAPVPKVTPTPTPTVTPTPTPTPTTGGVQGEHNYRCGSRRNFVIRLRPKGVKIVMARVILRGHRVRVSQRHGRWIATIDLRTLPKKRFKVYITTWSASGKRYHEVRRYWTCTPAR